MSNKWVFQYILASFFFLFFAPLSGAQNGKDLLTISRTERRYIQRLAWAGDVNTLRYEIVVEREDRGSYRREKQVSTKESFIELTLQPGNYRCRVIPYDFLDRPGEGSEWMVFEILAPGGGEVPESNEEEKNLIAELEPEKPESETPEPAEKEIMVDFYLSVAWMPMIPIYGGTDLFAGQNHALYSGGIRLGLVSTTQSSFNFGMEFAVSLHYATPDSYRHEGKIQYMNTIELILLTQKWFPGRVMAFNLRTGGGYTSFQKTSIYGSSENLNCFHTDLGISLLLRPVIHFYLETGVDYIHEFTQDSFGFLRPWFGIGLRF